MSSAYLPILIAFPESETSQKEEHPRADSALKTTSVKEDETEGEKGGVRRSLFGLTH